MANEAGNGAEIPVSYMAWPNSVRIVSSLFPSSSLFDVIDDPADLEDAYHVEALSSERALNDVGDITLVPSKDRISGPGTTPIMTAFTHPNTSGSRFSDGSYGVYYAARTLQTAIAETCYHRERFLRMTESPAICLEMRVYHAQIRAGFHDIRGRAEDYPELYDPDPEHYSTPQGFGRALRAEMSWGIAYDSVRHLGGDCAAVFRPRAIKPVRNGPHLAYHYDGERIRHVSELRENLQ